MLEAGVAVRPDRRRRSRRCETATRQNDNVADSTGAMIPILIASIQVDRARSDNDHIARLWSSPLLDQRRHRPRHELAECQQQRQRDQRDPHACHRTRQVVARLGQLQLGAFSLYPGTV